MTWLWILWIVVASAIALWKHLEEQFEKREREGRVKQKENDLRSELERQRREKERKARWDRFVRHEARNKVGGKSIPPDWSLRTDYVLRRDGNKCVHCGATSDLQVHHIDPKAKSQNHSVDNLETVCIECHQGMPGPGHSLLKGVPRGRDRDIGRHLYAYKQYRSRKEHIWQACKSMIRKGDNNYVERGYYVQGMTKKCICEECLLKHVRPRRLGS